MRKQSITFILVCFTSLISIVWKPIVSMSLGSNIAVELPETLPHAGSTSWNEIVGGNGCSMVESHWNFCVVPHDNIMFPYLLSLFLFPETLLPRVLALWPPTRSGQTGLWCYGAWPRVETEALTPWPIFGSSRLVCAGPVWDWMLQHCNFLTKLFKTYLMMFFYEIWVQRSFQKTGRQPTSKHGGWGWEHAAEIGLGGEKATPSRSPKGWGFACLLLTFPRMVYDIYNLSKPWFNWSTYCNK